jgi:hypothetical protein
VPPPLPWPIPRFRALLNGSTGSGSTGWKGTFRSQLYLESPKPEEGKPSDPDIRILRRAKANYARRDETIEIRWQNGVFVPVHAPTGVLGSIERKTCERVFCDLLAKITAERQHVSHNSRAGNYAPRIFALRPDRERFTKSDFERALATLLANRTIKITTYKDAYRRDIECLALST